MMNFQCIYLSTCKSFICVHVSVLGVMLLCCRFEFQGAPPEFNKSSSSSHLRGERMLICVYGIVRAPGGTTMNTGKYATIRAIYYQPRMECDLIKTSSMCETYKATLRKDAYFFLNAVFAKKKLNISLIKYTFWMKYFCIL